MRQAAAALFGAGFTVAACYAAGALLIDQLRVALRREPSPRRSERERGGVFAPPAANPWRP
jgi:hypothetical protein